MGQILELGSKRNVGIGGLVELCSMVAFAFGGGLARCVQCLLGAHWFGDHWFCIFGR